MKKLALTIAIVFGLSFTTFANGDQGGMFQRGDEPRLGMSPRTTDTPMLPHHDQVGNQNAPVGSGIAVLMTLGAAYLVSKKNKEE